MSVPPYRCVTVVGVGLIGGSVGAALRSRGLVERVVGVVRDTAAAEEALACGVVDEATKDLAVGCAAADVVVVATPVGSVVELVLAAAEHAPDALITDAGSTKRAIIAAVGSAAPRFVGAHPLAGDHRSGAAAARADCFCGATTVLTPTEASLPEAVAGVRAFWESLGSTVVEMSPTRHDELLAWSSHTPHVAAAAVAAITPKEALPLTAGGWADTTRVAAGAPELWREILLANARPVAGGLRKLAAELEAYAAALDRDDGAALERLLTEGKNRRDALGS